MLCITANWAIPDGTLAEPPYRGRFDRFWSVVRRSALQAGFRHDGRYRPIERIEVVLAGDTFDFLLTNRWLDAVRPWHRGVRSQAVRQQVMEAAWACGGRHLGALAALVRRGIDVPAADQRGRPVVGAWTTVPLAVTFLVGDRDRGLDAVAGTTERGFAVGEEWVHGDVVVRHGAELDPLAAAGDVGRGGWSQDDRAPTLRESLVVDLVSRFAALSKAAQGQDVTRGALVRVLADARPLDMPGHLRAWLARALERGAVDRRGERLVVDAWTRAVDAWHRSTRRHLPAADVERDVVDEIAASLVDLAGSRPVGPVTVHLDDSLQEAAVLGPLAPARIAVFGHPPAVRVLGDGSRGARIICLGPATVARSAAGSMLGRGTAIDVAWVEDASDVGERALPVVTLFEADEGTGRGTIALTDGIPEVPDEGSHDPAARLRQDGCRIIDAA